MLGRYLTVHLLAAWSGLAKYHGRKPFTAATTLQGKALPSVNTILLSFLFWLPGWLFFPWRGILAGTTDTGHVKPL